MVSRTGTGLLLLSALVGPIVATTAAEAGSMYTHADCAGSTILVGWTLYDDPGGHPYFAGYDLYRRTQPQCGPPVRLNDQSFPRQPGQTHSHSFVDTTVAPATMYRYDVWLVDENHHPVPWQGFCDPCFTFAWESCPRFSAPLVQGTLGGENLPLWLSLWPCPGVDCYEHFYIGRRWPAELELYVNTGIAVRLYGSYACGNTEGCFIENVVGFDVQPCGVVSVEDPPRLSTWGAIKSAYR